MNKRGQVTIFIILGIVIVAGIITFIVFSKDIPSILNKSRVSSMNQVENCIKNVLNEKYPLIMENGGKLNPLLNVVYEGKNHTVICYIDEPFKRCINYYHLLKEKVSEEIRESSSAEIEQCFNNFIKEYERQGYSVTSEDTNNNVHFESGVLYSDITKRVSFTKGNNTELFEDFTIAIPTKSSQLLDVAQRIVNEESEYCSFDVGSYMQMYPEYSIFKTAYEGGTTLYQLKYRETGEEFNFAVKSCTLL